MNTNSEKITYTIKRIKRTKRVKISVNAQSRVIVTAPVLYPQILIKKFVYEKREWIVERQNILQKQKKNWIIPEHINKDSFESCRAQSKKFIRDKVKYYNEYYHYSYNRIAVKNMKTRWGSCSSKNNLNFHYRLMFLPIELADYIVVHELCHLKEMNHSDRFWRLVAKQIPDYKRRRVALKHYPL